jgi:cytochrome b subunit of formate dehydrogenase
MWPSVADFHNLVQVMMFNLGLAKQRPESDRFSVEEKLEYWALLWGTPVMGITGFILWFPTIAASVLPGESIPIAQAIHKWEAILATLAILTWHMYHTNIKEKNRSIFNGTMTEEEMRHAHPLEYRRILAAREHWQRISHGGDGRGEHQAAVEIVSKVTSHRPS